MEKPGLRVTAKAVGLLSEHAWPGNVRELENAVRRAVAMADSDVLDARDFEFLPGKGQNADLPEIVHMDEYMRRVLQAHGPRLDLKEIANRLGVSRKTLWEKKKKLGL